MSMFLTISDCLQINKYEIEHHQTLGKSIIANSKHRESEQADELTQRRVAIAGNLYNTSSAHGYSRDFPGSSTGMQMLHPF